MPTCKKCDSEISFNKEFFRLVKEKTGKPWKELDRGAKDAVCLFLKDVPMFLPHECNPDVPAEKPALKVNEVTITPEEQVRHYHNQLIDHVNMKFRELDHTVSMSQELHVSNFAELFKVLAEMRREIDDIYKNANKLVTQGA